GMPENYRYIGPITWEADLPEPAWLQRLDPSRPTLYFTMGSTGDAQFFDEAIRVFGDTEYQILITTGGLADLGSVPSNVFVEQYAPGKALMNAADVVVSHGGNGTIYQALSSGVPIIGFPSIFDQEINLQRVCALGAGLRMWRSEYDAKTLKRAVEQVLGEPAYRTRCQELARRIAYMDGPRRAALHIDHLLGAGDPVFQPQGVRNAVRLLAELDAAESDPHQPEHTRRRDRRRRDIARRWASRVRPYRARRRRTRRISGRSWSNPACGRSLPGRSGSPDRPNW